MNLKDGDLMTTGDVAKALGVSAGRVDQLELEGQLKTAARTVGGFRPYWSSEVAKLDATRRARARARAAKGRA